MPIRIYTVLQQVAEGGCRACSRFHAALGEFSGKVVVHITRQDRGRTISVGKARGKSSILLPPNKQRKWQRACFRAHIPQRQAKAEEQVQRRWYMTTANARRAFVRSYDLPTILMHYPRLVRAMRGVIALNGDEAAICIRDLKAGRRWSGEAVNHYGGTHKVAADAWKCRRATRVSRPVSRWRWQGGTRDVERQTSERLEVA
jgi:hypothetical protein